MTFEELKALVMEWKLAHDADKEDGIRRSLEGRGMKVCFDAPMYSHGFPNMCDRCYSPSIRLCQINKTGEEIDVSTGFVYKKLTGVSILFALCEDCWNVINPVLKLKSGVSTVLRPEDWIAIKMEIERMR